MGQAEVKFSESLNDSITTVCYGEIREWDERAEARNHFLEAMMNSDGSERERYSNVYFRIMRGLDYCTDSDSD